MKRLRRTLVHAVLVSVTILSVCLASCGGNGSTIIPETTKVLDETTLSSLSAASVNSSTLSFGNITEQLGSLSVGDVIVCGVSEVTPYGLLRKVTDIVTEGNQMMVETVNATLEDAIQQCDISGTWSLLPDGSAVPLGTLASESTQTCVLPSDTNAQPDSTDGMNSAAFATSCTGWYIDINDQVLFDLDKDLGTKNDQIVADGSLCADVRLDFGFKIKDWKLKEARFLVTTVETAELEITLQAGFASVSEKLEVYRKWLKPFTLWVGAVVPIVVVPVLTFNVGVDATASAGISTSITFNNDVTVGVRYSGGAWSPVTDRSTSFEWGSPSLTAGCEVKGYVGPQLTLLLCGITGPYGEVRGYLDLDADLFETPWWKLYGGVEADVGFRAEILGHFIADYEVPAAIGYRVLLAQAETGTPVTLTISSTSGGTVSTPGEGTFSRPAGTVVNLVATPASGYRFVKWTGDVGTVANVNAAETTVTMNGDYSIMAKFVSDDSETIWDWYDLDAIRNDLDGSYILMNDLDSTTPGYEELVSPIGTGGVGWQPIGTSTQRFIGTFDGQGYGIFNLFTDRLTASFVGLFGYVGEGGIIENINLVDAYVSGSSYAGGLIGRSYKGVITNCHCTSTVTGASYVGGLIGGMSSCNVSSSDTSGSVIGSYAGGLVGTSSSSIIENSYSTCIVTSGSYIGGLIGKESGDIVINNCWASGNVGGGQYVGGLIGYIDDSGTTVTNSYSTSTVTGSYYVGGLVGFMFEGTVSSCFATGDVAGSWLRAGGLAGGLLSDCVLTNSYSTGSVTGDNEVGGLVGSMYYATVANSYSTGSVAGNSNVGGLVGRRDYGSVTKSFWDVETSGRATSAGGTGKTTAEMQDISTFSGAAWHVVAVADSDARNTLYLWNIVDGGTYPFLSWEGVS
ncbi:MAG TPA: GLUG motif-containing protein [Dehalococcoidia bacterium]|nr:GLUG motif-containing protein [Dehalococcoidia bacterium]